MRSSEGFLGISELESSDGEAIGTGEALGDRNGPELAKEIGFLDPRWEGAPLGERLGPSEGPLASSDLEMAKPSDLEKH